MVVGVGTDVVVVATCEGSQEGWRHVARAGSVSEALLYTHTLSQALSFNKWQSLQYLYIIAMASLRYHKKQSIKAISLCVTSLTGYSIHNTRQRAQLQHAWSHWHAGKSILATTLSRYCVQCSRVSASNHNGTQGTADLTMMHRSDQQRLPCSEKVLAWLAMLSKLDRKDAVS